jgi:hypothetical protein
VCLRVFYFEQSTRTLIYCRSVNREALKYDKAQIAWHHTEQLLMQTDSDVLAIFDCCNAGSLCRSRSPTRFEYLAACAAEQTTPSPGPGSFTTALIWALQELLPESPFSTSKLQYKIKQAPKFPKHQLPVLAHRMTAGFNHILLSPSHNQNSLENSSDHTSETSEYLDLRFHFNTYIDENTIRRMAESLNLLLSDQSLYVHKISFLGKSNSNVLKNTVLHWQQFVIHRRALMKRFGQHWLSIYRSTKSQASNPYPTPEASDCCSIGSSRKTSRRYSTQ